MTNVLTAFSCQRTFVIFYLLNSDITRGVVHNYAFSCIHRHIGCRQRKCTWNLDGAHAVVVNAEPLLPYTVDLFCILASFPRLLSTLLLHYWRLIPLHQLFLKQTSKRLLISSNPQLDLGLHMLKISIMP